MDLPEERTERLVAMGQMAASMAHEIRNPLGGMELFCSLLAKELKERDEGKLHSLAEQILKGIRTVDRVIQNCLQFAREIVPQKSDCVSLKQFLAECQEQLGARVSEVDIQIESAEHPAVYFDPFLMQQVVVNLLSNAADAITERSRKLKHEGAENMEREIFLRTSFNESTFAIEVQDSGEGISPEAIARIFDPFMTTKTTGTGLGLAICHSIVRAHGGEIEVESEPGRGSVFRVVLPR